MSKLEKQFGWEPEDWPLRLVCGYARKVPQHAGKGRILRWLIGMLCPRGGWLRSENGARFHVDPSEYIGWEIVTCGEFEPQSVRLSIELMKDAGGHVFLDVGANQGLFTCAVGCGANCDVVAVEAAPDVFARLQQNTLGNSVLRSSLVHACAAPAAGLVKFFVPRNRRLSAWGGPKPKENVAGEGLHSFWSGSVPLENILRALGVPAVKLMKIDVEGYELEAFSGLDWSGLFRPSHIIMECAPHEREKIAFLENHGYSARTIDGAKPGYGRDFPEGNLWFVDCRPTQRM